MLAKNSRRVWSARDLSALFSFPLSPFLFLHLAGLFKTGTDFDCRLPNAMFWILTFTMAANADGLSIL